jgi:ABC-type antimicrobial peptide transport system permease subunit
MFQAGADIRIDVNAGRENLTLNVVDNLTAVDGVGYVAAMLSTNAYVRYTEQDYYPYYGTGVQNRSIRVFAVQPSEWYTAAFWLPYFAYSGDPQTSLQRLAESNTSVITSFKPVTSRSYSPAGPTITYGDTLELTITGMSWVNRSVCTIVDVLGEDLAGQGRTYFPGQPDVSDFLIINLPYVQSCLRTASIDRLYIHLKENANYTKVIQALAAIAPDSFRTIDSGLERMDDALASRAGRAIFGVYTLNILFSLAFLTIGIGIVSVERVHKLRRQLSVFRALGGETKSISISVAVETLVSLMIAAAIGSLLSLVLAYLLMKVPLTFFGTQTATVWSRLPIGLVVPTELLLSIVGLTFLCSLCSTFIVTRRGLGANIAEEIQVEE